VALVTALTGAFGFATLWSILPDRFRIPIGISLGIYIGVVVGFEILPRLADLHWVRSAIPDQLTLNNCGDIHPWQKRMIPLVVLVVGIVILSGLRFGIISLALGAEIPVWLFFILPAMMYSVTILPISVSGLGITEVTGSAVLMALGVSPEIAAAVVVVDRFAISYLPVVAYYLYSIYLVNTDGFTPVEM
jgi:uncharacterized membrane protein YbhN (UPF0104 family)